jgi:hypothetical protein
MKDDETLTSKNGHSVITPFLRNYSPLFIFSLYFIMIECVVNILDPQVYTTAKEGLTRAAGTTHAGVGPGTQPI